MAPKRPNDTGDGTGLTGRDRKKHKMEIARTIAIQPTQAGPSSMARLPNVIDVEKFTEARAFEVNAMKNAMKSASGSAAHRVWQTLPREMRRRAASHDVKRVPARLREKARAEMDIKQTAPKHKPTRGKSKQISRTDAFLKRQRDKTWLETHIWHAKRMKMVTKWGYRLALHPSDKAFRPSHRAAVHGSILHDASYQSLIEVSGQHKYLKLILDNCCSPQAVHPSAPRFTSGMKTNQIMFYECKSYPFGLIAPVTLMWRPLPPKQSDNNVNDAPKPKATDNLDDEVQRVLWIRAHPAVHDQVFDALHASARAVIDTSRNAMTSIEIEIADMRGKVNIFDIMGPKSSQVIKGALQPTSADDRPEFKQFWAALGDLQTSASVPRGMVIGFTVNDPRLKFPPKNSKPGTTPNAPVFPTSTLARSELWEETKRKAPKFKKKELDERRAKNLVPGTKLTALRQDDRVPVILIQKSLESSCRNAESLHGWTLIIPSGWSMAFFSSLIYTGTRVGGQRECQTQAFEAGIPFFPRDFPFTAAFDAYAAEREMEEKKLWEKKPPAKRVNYETLEVMSPWRPDWEVILGLKKEGWRNGLVDTQRDAMVENTIKPWFLCGNDVATIIAKTASVSESSGPESVLRFELNALRAKQFLDPLVGTTHLLAGALVSVRIKMHRRGCPEDMAMLYGMSDSGICEWKEHVGKSPVEASMDVDFDEEGKTKVAIPPTSSIIGYITTGHFSLMRGEAFALGCVPLTKYIELERQAKRMYPNSPKLIVRVRNTSHDVCRVAYVELM